MNSYLGIVLLILGSVLIILGFYASESVASSFSRFFTGQPSDKAIWLFLGGLVALGVGASLAWRRSRI